MPVSNPINFAINGTTCTNQPSGIQEIFPENVVHSTLSGRRVIVESSAGPIIEVIWGVDAARKEVTGELRNRRSASGSVTISYLDMSGTTQTRTVFMPRIPYEQFLLTHSVAQLSIQFPTLV